MFKWTGKYTNWRSNETFHVKADSLAEMRKILKGKAEDGLPQVVRERDGDRRYGVEVTVRLIKQ